MLQIRPISDLRNKFSEIETLVSDGNPVYLTRNGHGTMVLMSLEQYSSLTARMEDADENATHDVVFQGVKKVTKKVKRGSASNV